ncbi:diguanylate cyclase [Pseudomonas sp. DTU_2021_1001937_2_SI_NGA_ILE_001]|uniref:diguanylate cyclase domain-containing protein n=1 Tax=Pseudomonas sp. DTU_2021_1001937_2_SI_NGA_ILE_001 TaxID=3077589 RepID=UPI0028FC315A|nr:diguanylate cyclase [Pseudomonas sp. DTU_2021_1001937_2_SI_NGA_ILE_001]WNW09635.1 diguanylate cyclase [Pseudomonas sp. DTU_2021_1001937_2_SI_NGA_ILE_001]
MEKIACTNLEGFVDMLMDAICVVDSEGRFVYVNAAFERIFGYSPQELIGIPMLQLVHPDDRARTLEAAAQIMGGEPKLHFENRYLHKQGNVVDVMWSARWSEEDRLRIAVARDITALKRANAVRATLLEISAAASMGDDLHGLFTRIHQLLSQLLSVRWLSIALQDVESGTLSFAYRSDELQCAATQSLVDEVLSSAQPRAGSDCLAVPLQTSSGIIGALLISSGRDEPAQVAQDLELLQIVSSHVAAAIDRKQLYERLQVMARYDQLTGLANRVLLQERLNLAVRQAERYGDKLAALYLDLDHFKQVNDTLGHAAGDALLQEVARRLSGCVRDSDTVARIGGDEFVVLLERVQGEADASRTARAIARALQAPVRLGEHDWTISASIGIACYPDDAGDLAQLFRHADQAMYQVKKQRHTHS